MNFSIASILASDRKRKLSTKSTPASVKSRKLKTDGTSTGSEGIQASFTSSPILENSVECNLPVLNTSSSPWSNLPAIFNPSQGLEGDKSISSDQKKNQPSHLDSLMLLALIRQQNANALSQLSPTLNGSLSATNPFNLLKDNIFNPTPVSTSLSSHQPASSGTSELFNYIANFNFNTRAHLNCGENSSGNEQQEKFAEKFRHLFSQNPESPIREDNSDSKKGSNEEGKPANGVKVRQNRPRAPPTRYRHLEILSKYTQQRLAELPRSGKASECRLCGSHSTSTNPKIITCFIRKHLYTHVPNLYSCTICKIYKSNAMTRIRDHIRKYHDPKLADDFASVHDSRQELDDTLYYLAEQCFKPISISESAESEIKKSDN